MTTIILIISAIMYAAGLYVGRNWDKYKSE